MIVLASGNSQEGNEEAASGAINSTNLSLSINLVPTLVDFINSSSVLDDVTTQINQKHQESFKTSDLKKMVSASARTYTSLEKSLYIDVSASTDNEVLSKDIVNATLETAIRISNDAEKPFHTNLANCMTISSPAGEVEDTSTSKALTLLIGVVAGIVIGMAYGLIFELCNTHVVSASEIEAMTGLNVIGVIPDIESKGETK